MARLVVQLACFFLGIARVEAGLNLNITALTGKNNVSVLECWQLSSPFVTSDTPGVAGLQVMDMGTLSNATYTVIPARFDGGLHHAPFKQWVWFISGLIEFSLPNGTDTATIYGGRYGLIFADDTQDISGWGHETVYPSSDEVIVVTSPVRDNVAPKHVVLHSGPCAVDEQVAV